MNTGKMGVKKFRLTYSTVFLCDTINKTIPMIFYGPHFEQTYLKKPVLNLGILRLALSTESVTDQSASVEPIPVGDSGLVQNEILQLFRSFVKSTVYIRHVTLKFFFCSFCCEMFDQFFQCWIVLHKAHIQYNHLYTVTDTDISQNICDI